MITEPYQKVAERRIREAQGQAEARAAARAEA